MPVDQQGEYRYRGAGLGPVQAWACPACAAENCGTISDGCVVCGAGTARASKVEEPDQQAILKRIQHRSLDGEPPAAVDLVRGDMDRGLRAYSEAINWNAAHPNADIPTAFLAGYQFALAVVKGQMLTAPPVTADTPSYHPAGRMRRTIIAALELFRDQALRGATDEISSGEWATVEQVNQEIVRLSTEDDEEEKA